MILEMRKIGITKELIKEVVQKIVQHFHPKKVILFGSCAHGKIGPDSDIDLFLIMKSNLRRDKRAIEVDNLFSDRLFPLDVLVYTPEEVELSLRRNNFFIKEILTQGKVFYG